MEIIIQTSEDLSAQDRAILKCLLMSEGEAKTFLAGRETEKTLPAPKPAKKRKTKKAEPEAEETPEPEAEEAPEPEAEEAPEPEAAPVEEDDADEGDPMAAAVAKATKLVSEGKSSVVKAALADLGVRRVSELDDGNVGDFLKALQEG